MSGQGYRDYGFWHADASHMHERFMPQVFAFVGELRPGTRVLDVGCGNGYTCGEFIKRGCKVVGVDLSEKGIALARAAHPEGRFEVISAESDLLAELNEPPFDFVVSTEVVEHLYAPRQWAKACFDALRPGGRLICTTPYHGYLKNLLLSIAGKWDQHANPLWDGGHIKLWSKRTLGALLAQAGFIEIRFRGVGRAPLLWMTMVVSATRGDVEATTLQPLNYGTAKRLAERAEKGAHILPLDGLRGVAVLSVLVFHFWQGTPHLFATIPAAGLLSIGQKGVDLFFVLSGFLITGILLQTKEKPHYFRNFYGRRSLRIFPLYYAVVIGCVLVALFAADRTAAAKTWWYFVYLQNVADTFRPDAIIGPGHFWSLAIEEQFYLVWPLIVLFLGRNQLLLLTACLFVGAAVIRVLFISRGIDVFTFTLCRMDTLALGAMLAICSTDAIQWARVKKGTLVCIGPLLLLSISTFSVLSGSGLAWVQATKYSLFAVVCGMLLVLAITPARYNPLPGALSAGWL